MNRALVLLSCVLLINININAQHDIDRFHSTLEMCNLAFKLPEGYEELEVQEFRPIQGQHFDRMYYSMVNLDKDILIGFLPVPYIHFDEEDMEFHVGMAKLYNPDITSETIALGNNAWKGWAGSYVDLNTGPPVPLDAKMTALAHADTAVIFPLKMEYPYKGHYTKCKYVIIHRDNRGDGRILYFYHNGNAHLVDDEIERTWGMLQFRADSLHKPTPIQRTRKN